MVYNLLTIKKPLINQWLFLLKRDGEIGFEFSIREQNNCNYQILHIVKCHTCKSRFSYLLCKLFQRNVDANFTRAFVVFKICCISPFMRTIRRSKVRPNRLPRGDNSCRKLTFRFKLKVRA